ncbi:hypothetical protein [Okeania sp.]|uniref:hypothetical protein n=1 Tax=Okeania sp. TaxID=3100323 RepID=UPI002B4B82CF|nr:hypothetical protein [Okeania sp.]MEB3342532.1 hypothetical protein [Okeania sp.]
MFEYNSVKDAIKFIETYQGNSGLQPLVKYEIQINYNTGHRIEGKFTDKQNVIQFLRTYQLADLRPIID